MNDEGRFEELREKEIKRLTTPITYVKGTWKTASAAYDSEGNKVDPINTSNGKKYIIEPKPGILSDDEILMYAPLSDEASRIKLRRGKYKKSDIWNVYRTEVIWFIGCGLLVLLFSAIISYLVTSTFYLTLILLILMICFLVYLFFIHDFTDNTVKETVGDIVKEQKLDTNNDLLLLFESKEKIAREMIEKKFPAPQLTNLKFNSALDNCKDVVESQIEILNTITPTNKTKYEIDSRKKLIKQVIGKIDDLTNELILSEENNLEDVIEDMDLLIKSVKEY